MSGIKNFKKDLQEAAKNNPQLFVKKLKDIGITGLELDIMIKRYVEGLLIKQIDLGIGERWIKTVHAKAIMKTLDRLTAADLLDLGMPINTTPRTLYQV